MNGIQFLVFAATVFGAVYFIPRAFAADRLWRTKQPRRRTARRIRGAVPGCSRLAGVAVMQAVKFWFALVLLVVLAVGVMAGFVDWAAGVISG